MILTELKIHHLRNISSTHINLNSRFNFIVGPNGSGKTSILEALYLLSCGRSFRSREISPIISHDQDLLTVFSRTADSESISIQKSRSSPTRIKLNNQFCNSTSQLAYALPSQIIYSDLFNIIDAGPSIRRSVLEWGMFHVKHHYLALWKDYKKALKQRNALLKTRSSYTHFIPWDKQLSSLGNQLHELREEYFSVWESAFYNVLHELTDVSCSIKYYKGWDKKNSGARLEDILYESFQSDCQRQYTQHGAHQADIIIESEETKAKNILSRGQQKIILIALKLAQCDLIEQECLYLFDDFSSELDEVHLKNLFNYISQRPGQYLFTTTQLPSFIMDSYRNQGNFYTIEKGSIV